MFPNAIPFASVISLYFRPTKSQPLRESQTLTLLAGKGINGDCHSNHLSPRQVLIASSDTYTALNLPANALRENLLLKINPEFNHSPLTSGDTLSLTHGTREVMLRIMFQCEPCGRLNKTRQNLCRDVRGQRGWLARVVRGGSLQKEDTLLVIKNVYPTFSDDWRERVISIASLLPENRSLSYLKLAELAGVANSYCRAFPHLLRTNHLPTERIVPSSISPAPLPEWNGTRVFNPEPPLEN